MMPSTSGPVPFVHSVGFAVAHYAALLGLAALAYAIGRRLTPTLEWRSSWERAAVCTSLGLGAISYLVFALCLAHWLYAGVLLGALGALAVVSASELRALARDVAASIRRKHANALGIGAGCLIVFLPYAFLALYPPQAETSFDALMYHLVEAKQYVQHHGLVFAPYVHLSLLPQFTEMLFTLMLTLFDDIAAQTVSVLVFAVLLIAVFAWGSQLFSRATGLWASAILAGIPMVVWLGTTAYVDITLTLFGTMALFALWNWLQHRAPQSVILAAVFAGFAAATKYPGLFFIGLIALVVLCDGMRRRRCAPALLFVAIAAASAAPWYARTVYYTGNPVFPFLPTIFGHGYWTADEAAAAIRAARPPGIGRSVSSFVTLPWHLAVHPAVFRAEPGMGAPRKFFLLMPLALPFAFVDRRIAFLCAAALSYLVFWFFASQDMRFLVPSFPLISLSIAAALTWTVERRPLGRRWARNGVVVGLVCAAGVYVGWITALDYLRYYGPLPVTPEQRDAYLERFLPAYPAVRFLNTLNKGRPYTLFPIGGKTATMAYFTNGTFIGADFGVAHSAGVAVERGDNPGLYRQLGLLGAGYVLVFRGRHAIHEDAFFRSHFRLVYPRAALEAADAPPPTEAGGGRPRGGPPAAAAGVVVYEVVRASASR